MGCQNSKVRADAPEAVAIIPLAKAAEAPAPARAASPVVAEVAPAPVREASPAAAPAEQEAAAPAEEEAAPAPVEEESTPAVQEEAPAAPVTQEEEVAAPAPVPAAEEVAAPVAEETTAVVAAAEEETPAAAPAPAVEEEAAPAPAAAPMSVQPAAAANVRRVAFDKETMRRTAPVTASTKLTKKQQKMVETGHKSVGRRGPVASKHSRCKAQMQDDLYLEMAKNFERLLTNVNTIDAHLDSR